MPTHFDIDDVILNYDPAQPHARFLAAGLEGAFDTAEARLPSVIPGQLALCQPPPLWIDRPPTPTISRALRDMTRLS